MKVLRITRHKASPAQMNDLLRIFGNDVTIITRSETLSNNTREFVARFNEMSRGFDVVEAVLPISLLQAALNFSDFEGMIIKAVTNRELTDDGDVTFIFDHYEQVLKIEVVTKVL